MTTVVDQGTPADTTPAVQHVIAGGTIANPAPVSAPAAAPAAAPAGAPAAAPAPAPAPIWPEDWRAQMAGDDEKELKQIGRYATPSEVWKKTRQLEAKLSGGTLKPVLADDASEEDIADYRKAHGIPEAPDKYDLKDLKLGDNMKPVVTEILKAAHGAHLRPDQVKAVLSILPGIEQSAAENRAATDHEAQTKAEDALRAEWGAEYRKNTNLIHGLLDSSMTPQMKELFLGGRLANGTPIGSSPDMLKTLIGLALIKNPSGTLVPSVAGDPMKGLDEAIAEIEELMRTNRNAYNKDDKKQARLRELYNAREQMKARA